MTLPIALSAYNQFIVYKLVPHKTKIDKTEKLPIDYRTGTMPAKGSGASSVWTSVDNALAAAARFGTGYGVGFSFAESDPFFFVDIDSAYDPVAGWSNLATSLVAAFPGAYVEVSQSGKGLHIIGTGTPPPHGCKNTVLGLELYHTDRFVALTGLQSRGDAGLNFEYVLPWLVEHYFPATVSDGEMIGWSDSPVDDWNGPTDDEELIRRALKSGSAAAVFGNKASFADLWYGDMDALNAAYGTEGRSEADAALAQHLAFWTGKDCERTLRLMHQSALVRDKWEREDYLPRTISKACARQIDVLQDKPVTLTVEYNTDVAAVPTHVVGSTYVPVDQQIIMFKGCVYVTDQHKILMPGGGLLKPDQFRVAFGGFSFPMDPGNERIVRNAWECFTESQAFRAPRADSSTFRPDAPFGTITKADDRSLVNTYWPIDTPRKAGDATPFITHLSKILPNTRDQQILMSYMAACVQHKGIKFQWAPLLQGVEGNGKTLFSRCVAFAIGDRYSHFPKASQIAKNFNAWMHGKIFIGVEDVYVPFSQQDVLEELKPMITGDRFEIERKGVDQVTLEVCCNFIMNCNDKGALRKSKNDRRIGALYSAQQSKEDLVRDGMSNGYFPKLYDWLKFEGGYEIVNELLHTYAIPPELNPANGHIAPLTSSTDEAILHGLGHAEQEILEAIEREDQGFKGGWVSSMAVDLLLERISKGHKIPPNKRRDLMLNVGYDWHPHLINGRVHNNVLPDGGKPRLFIRSNDPVLSSILNPADIAKAYSHAQRG